MSLNILYVQHEPRKSLRSYTNRFIVAYSEIMNSDDEIIVRHSNEALLVKLRDAQSIMYSFSELLNAVGYLIETEDMHILQGKYMKTQKG